MVTSQPPPRASPAGATTTGLGKYRIRMFIPCNLRIAPSSVIPHALLRGDHHHEQIRACAEIFAFIANHQSIEIIFHAVKRFGGDVKNIIIQRIHLGVELNQRHAVANVKQRRARIFR